MNEHPTLFTRLIQGEIPATIVHENEHCVAFLDIEPQAPTHVVICTREPIPKLSESSWGDGHERLLQTAVETAAKLGVTDFRVVINNGEGAGQSVPHLHAHLLAGRPLSWPPG